MTATMLRATIPLMATCLPLAAAAAELTGTPVPPGADTLVAEAPVVTVTATRTEKDVLEAPATVSVITGRQIEDRLVADIKDLVRYEPGVSVRNSPARFTAAGSSTGRDGNSGFNIRGLEGNRVLLTVDGVRVPDGFSFGPQATGRGDFADLGLVKSVEILRGPASALYGSDGVAGAVSLATKDPADLLADGDDAAAEVRFGYAGADDSWTKGALAAGRGGRWEALLAYTRRDGEEQETKGTNGAANTDRTKANPQEVASDAVLAKLVFRASDAHRFRLTLDHLDRDVDSTVLSAIAKPPLAATSVIGLTGRDDTERTRVSFDHLYAAGLPVLETLHWTAYHQDGKVRQYSAEDRNTAADRVRDSRFENAVTGLGIEATSQRLGSGLTHRFSYGGDVSLTRQEGLRDGVVAPVGERFPAKPFPDTDYVLGGLYVQDEVTALDGALTLYPALRVDYYRLDPKGGDPLYPYPTATASDWHLSPKLGGLYWVTPSVGLFANYARGYKAPSPSQVNNGFENLVFNYRSLPNPDLKPETSETIEGGLRFRQGGWTASATGFAGWYDDFIDQIQVSGSLTPTDPGIFQFVNLGKVKIQGAEAKLQYRADNGLGLVAAASYAKGDSRVDGVKAALDSVDPAKLVAGVSYRDPADRFGGELSVTRSAGKALSRTACGTGCASASLPFTPGAFTLVDLTGFWALSDRMTLRAGVFNLFDEKVWWWSDVRGVLANSAVKDAYSQPGRNASVSVTVRF